MLYIESVGRNYDVQFQVQAGRPGMGQDERISSLIERAGGLSKFAFPQGATLIRRTEYYGDEVYLEALMKLRYSSDDDS